MIFFFYSKVKFIFLLWKKNKSNGQSNPIPFIKNNYIILKRSFYPPCLVKKFSELRKFHQITVTINSNWSLELLTFHSPLVFFQMVLYEFFFSFFLTVVINWLRWNSNSKHCIKEIKTWYLLYIKKLTKT